MRRNANIRSALSTAAGFVLAAVFLLDARAATIRQVHVFILPGGFRVESVFLPAMQPVRDLLVAVKPESTTLHVCGLTPPARGQEVFETLRALQVPGTLEVKQAARNAIECAFPTERERRGRGA